MSWRHIVLEGYCFGEENHEYPCGRGVSPFCLGNEKIEHCPHFAYTDSDEREASFLVPLRLILKDKLEAIWEDVKSQLEWWFYSKWHFDEDFLNNIPTIIGEECPELKEWEDGIKKANRDFPQWLKRAEKTDD